MLGLVPGSLIRSSVRGAIVPQARGYYCPKMMESLRPSEEKPQASSKSSNNLGLKVYNKSEHLVLGFHGTSMNHLRRILEVGFAGDFYTDINIGTTMGYAGRTSQQNFASQPVILCVGHNKSDRLSTGINAYDVSYITAKCSPKLMLFGYKTLDEICELQKGKKQPQCDIERLFIHFDLLHLESK